MALPVSMVLVALAAKLFRIRRKHRLDGRSPSLQTQSVEAAFEFLEFLDHQGPQRQRARCQRRTLVEPLQFDMLRHGVDLLRSRFAIRNLKPSSLRRSTPASLFQQRQGHSEWSRLDQFDSLNCSNRNAVAQLPGPPTCAGDHDNACTTALPPKADVHPRSCHGAFVPEPVVSSCSKAAPYSITLSARRRITSGILRLIAFAVFILSTNWKRVA